MKKCFKKGKLFEEQLGKIKSHKAVLHLKSYAKPQVVAAGRVPFALKKSVEVYFKRLEAPGVIEKLNPATTAIKWAAQTVNHPMPTFEELKAKIARGREFMVIDLKDAYLQMEVMEQCRRYLIIATPVGYFRFVRLPFGVSASPSFSNDAWMSSCKGLTALIHS
ncbi:hypothetical protein J437_LFUL019036 [Ladona fulva]|uniref:Reverse transcriptase domain-containing protein n=1 Tax=Ladona fulva TaxID=123851 RepID=A0A8K0KT36_LADFU|nr:hypothetical protein J437_LFUL019036 [Ladona fulva]